jgi:ribosome biogenesis GTPase
MVVAVDRGRFTVELDAEHGGREVFAVKARELGRKGLAIGDAVGLVGDRAGGPDALARIIRRHPRRTILRRTADDTDPVERVVVANADQLAIVVSLADPEPQPRLIDRALVAAYDGGLSPLLVLTKRDLADPARLLASYRPLGVTSVAVQRDDDLDELRGHLTGKVTALLGTSGVGKSTLVNALVPEALRSTGRVNLVTGRGRHTSTSAVALRLPEGGWVVDTPGIRSFGLAHVDVDRFMHAFPDLVSGTWACPRGCTHDVDHCALDSFVAAGGAPRERLESLRRLLSSRSADSGDDVTGDSRD